MADIRVINDGTLIGFRMLTEAARNWVDDNVQSEGWQWLGTTLYVDHRMAGGLIDGMIDAGFALTD
jgi:hypothetical protein